MKTEKSSPEYESYMVTPPIGWPVHWYNRANRDSEPIAAICTAVEEPGRIKLYTTPPNSVPVSINGCYQMSNPRHEQHQDTTQRNGGWEFIPGLRPQDPYRHIKADRHRRDRARQQDAEARLRREQAEKARVAEEKAELVAAGG